MKHKVIITDDDPSVRLALGNLLDREGYEVAMTASGDEALTRLLEEGPFDLMLLDLNMPGKSGWDTFERVTVLNPLLPVLVITARSDQQSLAKAAGVSALAEKPLDLPHLLGTIRELITEPSVNRLRRLAGRQVTWRQLAAEPAAGGSRRNAPGVTTWLQSSASAS